MMSSCGEKKNTAPPMTLAPEPEHSVLTTDQSLKPKPARAQKSGAFLAVRTSRRAQPDLKVTCLTKDTGARSAYPANRVNSHSLLTNLGEQHSSVWRVLTSLPTRGRPARTDAPVLPATEAKKPGIEVTWLFTLEVDVTVCQSSDPARLRWSRSSRSTSSFS